MLVHAAEESELQSAQKHATTEEDKRIARHPPKNRDETGNAEALRKHRENVLRANEAAVKKSETGKRHKKDQCRRCHHPGVVTGTRTGNVRRNCRICRIGTAR